MHKNSCCQSVTIPATRRRFIQLASFAGGVALFGLSPHLATAAGEAEALVLSCIDYRLTDKVTAYLGTRGDRKSVV